ncbi:CD209 antigen-like [Lampris incognitus]|uniref:CD209 antigen-like n=1 Tax=Lampris incognitus TaxID=2546036 RepID=UPI0024B54E59|nr:CD209 antigen-like [Lampris incognitus]
METPEDYQKVKLKRNLPHGSGNKDGHSFPQNRSFGQGRGLSTFQHYRVVILCLALLDIILLVAAVAIGICCVKATEGYVTLSQDSVAAYTVEISFLQGNHSNVIKSKEEAQREAKKELASHQELKLQLKERKALNDGLQSQIEGLRLEQQYIKSNNTALEENCGYCLPKWVFLNSTCYFFSDPDLNDKRTWLESRADCINHGADLLVIDNWEEQKLVSDNVPSRGTDGVWWSNGFWIGLTDIEVEGTWVWVNNVTQQETFYWIEGEPNNHGQQGENCAALYSRGDPRHTWYDGKCNHHRYNWICEMQPK